MRISIAILFGSVVAMAMPGASFAKNFDVPKADEASSPACHAYEQSPDGSWKPLSCQEEGLKPQPAAKVSTRDTPTRDTGKATR